MSRGLYKLIDFFLYQRFCKNLLEKGVDIIHLKAFSHLITLNMIASFGYANKTQSFVS